jgi:RNA polymerase sigma factor (sigma-70 family)
MAEFNQLLISNIEYLKPYAVVFTHDSESAKDLLQETLCRALANRAQYSDETNIKGWLYTIMRNTFINNYRRKGRTKKIFNFYLRDFPENKESATGNPTHGCLEVKELLAVVHALPDTLRIPFCLHYEGYKYQEIADLIDITLGTIKSRIHLARKILREQISRQAHPVFSSYTCEIYLK